MSKKEYKIVENTDSFQAALARVKKAQKIFATYTQEQVDKIFLAAATALVRSLVRGLVLRFGLLVACIPCVRAFLLVPHRFSFLKGR